MQKNVTTDHHLHSANIVGVVGGGVVFVGVLVGVVPVGVVVLYGRWLSLSFQCVELRTQKKKLGKKKIIVIDGKI
jgi:hypothetical protein